MHMFAVVVIANMRAIAESEAMAEASMSLSSRIGKEWFLLDDPPER